MIVLDTNVISELMVKNPTPAVIVWLDRQVANTLAVTAITEAEIRYRIACLPAGQRRDGLLQAADKTLGVLLGGRVLPFDRQAASAFATMASTRRAVGRPISHAYCQIAAIALVRGAPLATRNISDFWNCGVEVVNPWEAAT